MEKEPLLDVRDLKVSIATERGTIHAVDGVTFRVHAGETLGIVGESGCGKSVTAESILRLFDEEAVRYGGEVRYEGTNLLALSVREMERIRGNDISMIFQDPMSSLSPVHTIGKQIAESLRLHRGLRGKKAKEAAVELLRKTGIPSPERRFDEHPHEISGGMRQRVMIAMALACNPKLLIADEPTTALDVTIQAQILDLISSLKNENRMGVILITHDLGVVAETCSRVAVMYLGQVVEEADVDDLFFNPQHPYTSGLMSSIPRIDGDRSEKLHVIEGTVPSLHHVPAGCRFASRCAHASERCLKETPPLKGIGENHIVRCWYPGIAAATQERGEEYEHIV
ncbi:ABC transporter ATP-binding protein [Paenibacillus sp. JJ-223]|uniref:ABC transporter ATP-binding protein n=1 Tax=Paenibacillus sp. JJ-223 TaxID=2905647 RepID=UPI001F26A380|nr:ABC transporter ATP-binding protein [Paenibacillus sp. JJ-223]CAH1205202.1 Oligopeptide transport ATP-binding protein OppD [Paenibacillus sp. JJ-223]